MAYWKWHTWIFIWVYTDKNKGCYSRLLRNYCRWGHLYKEILLLCLRYVRLCANEKPYICERFIDSWHIQGRSTGQTIGSSILLLLQRNRIDLSKCRTQACDGASPMSSEASGAVSVIKKEEPLAEYTHCRNYILNLAISYAI